MSRAQKKGLRGFLFNKPFPEMPRWKRILLFSNPFWALGGRIAWALKNRTHGGEAPPLRRKVQVSTYGNPIPQVYGTRKVPGSVVWATDIAPMVLTGNYDGHGQLEGAGEGEEAPLGCSLAVAVCEGPVDKITRIWANEILVYDAVSTGYSIAPVLDAEVTIYLGDESQGADPTITAHEGAGNVPAYRGLAYFVVKNFPLTQFGDQVPNFEIEVSDSVDVQYIAEDVTVDPVLSVPLSGDPEIYYLSKIGPYLYTFAEGSTLSRVDRARRTLQQQYNLHDTFFARVLGFDPGFFVGGITGLVLDETTEDFFILGYAVDTRGCIVRFGLSGMADNYATRNPLTGSRETQGIVFGDFLYTAAEDSTVRCYRKSTLARQWVRPLTGDAAGSTVGNFTRDTQGRLWLISWHDADPATGASSRFFLTRITTGGVLYTLTVETLGRCKAVSYDATRNQLLCGGGDGGNLVRVNVAGAASPTSLSGKSAGGTVSLFVSQRVTTGSTFWSFDGTEYHEVRLSDFTVIRSIEAANWPGVTHSNPVYDSQSSSFWIADDSTTLQQLFFDKASYGVTTIGGVISDICQAAGLEASQLDTDSLTGELKGYVVDSKSTPRAALEPILEAYGIECRETNGRIEFFLPHDTSSMTLTENDLGVGEKRGLPDLYEETFEEEAVLPLRCEVTYLDADRNQTEMVQRYSRRADLVSARGEVGIDLPVVMTATQARQLAENTVNRAWVERRGFGLSLFPRCLRLDAMDRLTLELADGDVQVKLDPVEIGANWIVRADGRLNKPVAYGSAASGVAGVTSTHTVKHRPLTQARILDTALIRDVDDNAGFYWAAAPEGTDASDWEGAVLERAVEGVAYQPLISTSTAAPMGVVETELDAEGGTTTFDYDQSFDVRLSYGELSSATEEAIVDDPTVNLCAIGNEAQGWELVNFVEAEDLGDNLWRLSGLLRGRRGTEQFMGTHRYDGIGSAFVLLDASSLAYRRVVPRDDEIGQTRSYKGKTVRTKRDGAPAKEIAHAAAGLKPYAPCQLTETRHTPATNDWTLLWFRRTRVGGELQDGVGPALGEETEQYQVDIVVGGVTKTKTITAPDLSAVSLSVDSGDDSINRASGSFLTDGFVPGQWIEVAGFSNSGNNGSFLVVSVTALKMVLDGALTTEAAGTGQTIEWISAGYLYTEATQIADWGSAQSSLDWTVYQMSARVGRGYGATL